MGLDMRPQRTAVLIGALLHPANICSDNVHINHKTGRFQLTDKILHVFPSNQWMHRRRSFLAAPADLIFAAQLHW